MKDVNGPRAFLFLQVEPLPSGYGTSTYSCRVKAIGILGSLRSSAMWSKHLEIMQNATKFA